MNEKTCCFTGHRKLPKRNIKQIEKHLDSEIDNLYYQGVKNFISSGALGFAQLAAKLIITKKANGYNIRLIFMLPFKNYGHLWSDDNKYLFQHLLMEADEVQYVSEMYHDNCMKKRTLHMLEQSDFLICALKQGRTEKTEYILSHANY